MNASRRLLLIRLSSLGDILHALPAFRSLRTAYPDAEIDWLVESRMAFLLGAVPGISNIWRIDTHSVRSRPWSAVCWRDLLGPIAGIRRRPYAVCIDFQGLLKTGILALLSGAPIRIGFSPERAREALSSRFYNRRPPCDQNWHVMRQNLALAMAAGGVDVPLQTELVASEERTSEVEALLRSHSLDRFVVLNPAAGWYTKQWAASKYGMLAARIQKELGLRTVVTTGPGEEALYAEIARSCTGSPPIHLALNFVDLIPLCRRAQLFIGGDTGPLHLAALMGTPIVGIYGPTSPGRNGPFSARDESIVHVLSCSFCYGRTCPTQNECMDIEVGEVFDAVLRRLRRETSEKRMENP